MARTSRLTAGALVCSLWAFAGCAANGPATTTVRQPRAVGPITTAAVIVSPGTPAPQGAGVPSTQGAGVPSRPLSGKVITVDPGHNGGNFTHPQQIGRLVDDGNGEKECDTTGTAAPDGYREADFNWDVAARLRALLRSAGARVVMTRDSNTGVGPCITQRAAIGNRAHSDAAISIHADGGPPGGSGFAVLVPAPIPSRANQSIIPPSRRLALSLRSSLERAGLHPSTYDGVERNRAANRSRRSQPVTRAQGLRGGRQHAECR